MGEVINSNAKVDTIAEDVAQSYQHGMARIGDVADACKSRLETAVQSIENARTLKEAAEKAESAAWVIVLAMDDDADRAIGGVRDEMWNFLGRPRENPQMNHVFPGGIGTYTGVDPRDQPLHMEILKTRILSASAPQWPDTKRAEWAATIEAARAPYKAAVDTFRPAEAAATVADAGYRAAVRAGHARLVSFKRDLKNLGLTEAQIHEIIPDRSGSKK